MIDGERYVVKHLSVDGDWIMRATGDVACRPLLMWRSGLLADVPAVIDHCFVGVATEPRGAALLLRDVSPHLVPEGDAPIPLDQHLRFVDHMAQLHAAFWDWDDTIGLAPLANRYTTFTEHTAACEEALGSGAEVPDRARRVAPAPARGPALRRGRPAVARERRPARRRAGTIAPDLPPRRLEDGQPRQPPRRAHDPPRLGGAGTGPVCVELGWYLALNRRRLPQTKEAAIDAYRGALDRHGVDTDPWWDRQLARAPRLRPAVRVGEGLRRAGRAGVVGGARGHGRGAPGVTTAAMAACGRGPGSAPGRRWRSTSVKPARRSRAESSSTGQK